MLLKRNCFSIPHWAHVVRICSDAYAVSGVFNLYFVMK